MIIEENKSLLEMRNFIANNKHKTLLYDKDWVRNSKLRWSHKGTMK
jgi:hypothetical protein